MSVVSIRAALETRLATISPALATAYENDGYKPVTGTPYQEVHLMMATPENQIMGPGYRALGYLQVKVKYPQKKGTADAAARADLIQASFPRGLSLTSGGITVTISKTPEISNGRVDEDRWAIPVKIPFYANRF